MSKASVNIDFFRTFFPALTSYVHGCPLIYFDSASTSQTPRVVVEAMNNYYFSYKANIGRGVYSFAEQATYHYEQSRIKVAQYIGASAEEIVFTAGATASIHLVVQSWASMHLVQGDEIILSAVEHHSNFVPWQELAARKGLIIKIAPLSSDGTVDMYEFERLLSDKTKLVTIVHTSNVVGGTNNIQKITQIAHRAGAAVLIDACQSIAHQRINVAAVGCDFLVFSGHKLYGPTGTGALYVRKKRIPELSPTVFGGGMVFSVGEKKSTYRPFPYGFEAGTPNIAGVIGLGAAVDFVQEHIDFDHLMTHERSLTLAMIEGLRTIPNVTILSFQPINTDAHGHMVTFVAQKYHAHDIAAYLDQYGIAVRAGHHCVQLYHQACNINASVRISFAAYNTLEEVNVCVQKLRELLQP